MYKIRKPEALCNSSNKMLRQLTNSMYVINHSIQQRVGNNHQTRQLRAIVYRRPEATFSRSNNEKLR
jgi:hypothetical protein